MSIILSHEQPRSIGLRPISVLASLAVFLLAPVWQRHWGLADDISWLIVVSEKLLDGQRLYVDGRNQPAFLGMALSASRSDWPLAACSS
jgi:hypothetical protein